MLPAVHLQGNPYHSVLLQNSQSPGSVPLMTLAPYPHHSRNSNNRLNRPTTYPNSHHPLGQNTQISSHTHYSSFSQHSEPVISRPCSGSLNRLPSPVYNTLQSSSSHITGMVPSQIKRESPQNPRHSNSFSPRQYAHTSSSSYPAAVHQYSNGLLSPSNKGYPTNNPKYICNRAPDPAPGGHILPNAASPGPIPATTPVRVFQDDNGIQWISFEYSRDRVKIIYAIRCDIDNVNINALSDEFKLENCVYPRAYCKEEDYKGNRLVYETECNTVGWALAKLNQILRGKRGLVQRAVDSWRNSNQDPRFRSRRVRRLAKMMNRQYGLAITHPPRASLLQTPAASVLPTIPTHPPASGTPFKDSSFRAATEGP